MRNRSRRLIDLRSCGVDEIGGVDKSVACGTVSVTLVEVVILIDCRSVIRALFCLVARRSRIKSVAIRSSHSVIRSCAFPRVWTGYYILW